MKHMAQETEIERAYRDATPGSAALAQQAAPLMPSGITHDSRHIAPYGLFMSHAEGAHKWDVDGNRYIDYFGGHGALLLGHNHPDVTAAARAQLGKGTHFAGRSELEIRWARLITEMVPSGEQVRFHASGSEATLMAVRLARAFTGRPRLMRFHQHYHGWQDDMTAGYASHFDGTAPIGVPEAVAAQTVAVDPYDTETVAAKLAPGTDIAAVILEPFGAATGKVPLEADFLRWLRELTEQSGVLLVFDEVITGFRAAPGGVQEATGVTPDLTALAKIVAGGLPGGAVTGRADIMAGLDFAAAARSGREKIYHPGTFNACPVSAAAGIAALEIIRDGPACTRAAGLADTLRTGLNDALREAGLPWVAYGQSSAFHLYMGEAPFDPRALGREGLHRQPKDAARLLRLALNLEGVDFSGWPGGLVSAAHEEADIRATLKAMRRALARLRADGVI